MQKVKARDHIADASGMIVDDGAAAPGQASASSDLAGASASAATSSQPRDEVVGPSVALPLPWRWWGTQK